MPLKELFKDLPDWLDPVKPCRECGKPIRIISAKLEDGTQRPQIVDAAPKRGGWVRVFLNTRDAAVHRRLYTIPGEPYLPFHRHWCPRDD